MYDKWAQRVISELLELFEQAEKQGKKLGSQMFFSEGTIIELLAIAFSRSKHE